MLAHLGAFVTRRARLVLVMAAIVLLVAAVLGVGAVGQLKGGGFVDPRSESQRAQDRLDDRFGGQPNLILLVTTPSGTVDDPAAAAAGQALAGRLSTEAGVSSVISYWPSRTPSLRSSNARQALVLAHLDGDDKQAGERARTLAAGFTKAGSAGAGLTVRAGGAAVAGNNIADQIGKDLGLAEGVAIPITLVLLLLAFGSVVAALLPLAIGIMAIFGTLAELSILGRLTDVSIYALNLTTAMGLGLSIDYALLIVNRYREELAGGLPPAEAVVRTLETAGRTVIFSAATVAAALAALLVFPLYFLRSFAYAGIAVVAIATLAAVVVLPALLSALGTRVNALPVRRQRARAGGSAESPFWRRVAAAVMRRPVVAGVPVVLLLLALGTPFLHVHFGTPDDRVLPTSAQSRQVGDALRTGFTTDETNTAPIVLDRSLSDGDAAEFSAALSRLPAVARVDGPAGAWARGGQLAPSTTPAAARFSRPEASYYSVVSGVDAKSAAGLALVHQLRAAPAPAGAHALVGGEAAVLVDQKHSLGSKLPLAGGLIALTTLVVLFLFTGSVVLPVKALILNGLSLSAVFGAMVWVFQDGHLAGLLGFTPTPTSTTMPPLLFCIAFGLSMDYEVFLLSRIKELRDGGASNAEAIAGGLARTGRIVSTAAALLAVTFFAFGLSRVSFIQLFGIGTAIAILVDATLIRGVLVPAFMRLAGGANWWSPGPLRRLHAQIGLTETPAPRTA